MDALFALADQARDEWRRETGEDEMDENAGAESMFVDPPCSIRTGRAFYTTDSLGDVHVCFGQQCPHVRLDREHNWVCSLSGQVVAVECNRENDPSWTGRSTGVGQSRRHRGHARRWLGEAARHVQCLCGGI